MIPETRNGALAQGPASTQISRRHHAANHHDDTAFNVWAVGYPPSGRRRHWLLIVRNCPFCPAGHHAHRGGPGGGSRRSGCGRGNYRVHAQPASVVAA